MKKTGEPVYPGKRYFIDTDLHEKVHHDNLLKFAKSVKVLVPEYGSGPLSVARVTYNDPVKHEIHAAVARDSAEVLEQYNDLIDEFLSGEEPAIGRELADRILRGYELKQKDFDIFYHGFQEFVSQKGYSHADLSYVFANL